jgi:hypothetical protein
MLSISDFALRLRVTDQGYEALIDGRRVAANGTCLTAWQTDRHAVVCHRTFHDEDMQPPPVKFCFIRPLQS